MTKISQIVRFILPRSQASATAFQELRSRVENTGLAINQYYGYFLENGAYFTEAKPKPENQMCWYLEWSNQSAYRASHAFMQQLEAIAEDKPKSLIFNLGETKPGEIIKGLESNYCELTIVDLVPHVPRLEEEFETSISNAFTDTYSAKGFTGGGWGYALNSNDPGGKETTDITEESLLDEKERRLPFFLLGWHSIVEHDDWEKTELFDVEVTKLKPYFGPGAGAFYVKFEKHS